MTEQAWIVTARWSNSDDTHHGPWMYAEQAEQWAKDNLDGEAAVTSWQVGILTPAIDTPASWRSSSR